MIKGLKKLFIGLLIGLPISFVNGYYNGTMDGFRTIDVNDLTIVGNDTYLFDPYFNVYTNDVNLYFHNTYITNNPRFFGWKDGDLYFYSSSIQGFLNRWCIDSDIRNCINGTFNKDLSDIIDLNPTISQVVIGTNTNSFNAASSYANSYICFYDNTNYYCVGCGSSDACISGLTGSSLNLQGSTFEDLSIYSWGYSPFTQGGSQNIPIPSSTGLDSYTYIEIGSGDYIDYYEQQEHFTEDLCYIGTKDLNSNYEDRIPYYQGTGYTIFDAYSNLYNTNSLTVNKVGMFLNMIYANYRSWFLGYNRDSNGNVIYNMIYSGGSIELDYSTGLVNPFLNNKAYLYFIGSTALQTPYIDVYVAGQDVALYCYYKLNNYSNDGENYIVNDDYDHNGLDQRVAVNSKNNRTQKTFYTGANEIIGKSWEGTPLEYFQQGSGFIDPSDFFNENFNKFKEVLTPLSPGDLGLGYVPGYIIMFMCALILFRFLGH